LAYARIHTETDHPHLHILISGNEIEHSKKTRISKKRFATIKKNLERYQTHHYPLLDRSMGLGPGKHKKTLTAPQTAVRDEVLRYLDRAGTQKSFERFLGQAGIQFYQRGKNLGVNIIRTGKRYRFQMLGLQKAYQTRKRQWEKIRVMDKDDLVVTKERGKSREWSRGWTD
jgi:hypothetical protein